MPHVSNRLGLHDQKQTGGIPNSPKSKFPPCPHICSIDTQTGYVVDAAEMVGKPNIKVHSLRSAS